MQSCRNPVSVRPDQCSVPHPCDPTLSLYFMADVPHLLKNMRSCLEKNNIVLPADTVSENMLPSSYAQMSHIESVVRLQEENELRLAPGLSQNVIHPGQYDKI